MIEENYQTYKEMYFVVFPASNLEGMAKELHAALIAYQNRIRELEAFQQSVQPTCSTCGTKLRMGDIWWNQCEKCHSKIASG